MSSASPRFLGALAITCALVPLSSTMLAVALPEIGRALGRSPAELAPWLVTSYLVVSFVAQGPGGRLADRLGCGRALLLGQAVFAVATLLAVAAPGLFALTTARVLMAAGGGVMVPAAMALLRDGTPEARRPRVFGWAGSVMATSAAIGPVVGGALTQRFGWHAIFLANLPVLALSTALLGRGAWRRTTPSHPPTERMAAAAARLLRIRPFAAGALTVSLHNAVMYAVLVATPALLSELSGVGAGTAGLTLLALTGGMATGGPLGGHLAERVGIRAVAATGGVVATLGVLHLREVVFAAEPASAAIALGLVGLGSGLASACAQAAAVSAAGPREGGLAAGVVSALRYAGGAAGVLVVSTAHGPGAAAPSAHALAVSLLLAPALMALALSPLLPGRRVVATA